MGVAASLVRPTHWKARPLVLESLFMGMGNALRNALPLRYGTPHMWMELVLRAPLLLLNDHAHLEKKAATNALELLGRWPDPTPPDQWVQIMTAVARDECEHLAIVTRLLARRGGRLTKYHRNPYATALRRNVRLGRGTEELMDRLFVSALIEARSCERFLLLGEYSPDQELANLYRSLHASEAGHYRVFVDLAKDLGPASGVEARWSELLDLEAAIIAQQPQYPGMHSGVGNE